MPDQAMRQRASKHLLAIALVGSLLASVSHGQVADPEADWEARSNAPGVFYLNNFDFADTQALIDSSYRGFGYTDRVQLDTTNKLSGRGAFRAIIPKSSGEGTVSYRHSFEMPVGTQTKNLKKKTFYYQFAIYLPRYILGHRFATLDNTSSTSHKFAIIMEPDQSFSSGEVVITNALFRGFVTGYRMDTRGVASGFSDAVRDIPCKGGSPNYIWQNAIDAGPQSSGGQTDATSCALYKQRYGPVKYDLIGSIEYGSPLSVDPDAALNGAAWIPDAWNVVEVFIDEPRQTFKMWHAKYGEPPKLVMNYVGTADLGEREANYTGVQLLPRLEQLAPDPTREDTYAIYDEIIASDEFIDFPGSSTVRPRPPANVTATE